MDIFTQSVLKIQVIIFLFAGYCCYSRSEFFWQTIERMETAEIICQTGLKACKVYDVSKACSACRYDKCVQVGMSLSCMQVNKLR